MLFCFAYVLLLKAQGLFCAMGEFTITDKYRSKMTIRNYKPTIYLSNYLPEFESEEEAEYWQQNSVIVPVYQPLCKIVDPPLLHAGCVARLEPSSLSDDNHLRPDLQLIMDQFNKLIDVTIVHPTCPSHIKQGQTQLKTCE